MPRLSRNALGFEDTIDNDGDIHDRLLRRRRAAERSRQTDWADATHLHRSPKRRLADGSERFKCGHCRAFIGPTVSGGRHRNHCPLCLTSRHVDDRRPGDRASACRSLMTPIGTFFRPKGEQVVLHCCRGCGLERHNRIAADDNPLALLRLSPVAPRIGGQIAVPALPHTGAAAEPARLLTIEDVEESQTG